MIAIPIFLSSDNNYAPFVATTIASICDNTKSFCEFYILDGGISEDNKIKINALKNLFKNLSIEYIRIDVENIFKGIKLSNTITLSAFNRLLAPQLVHNIRKAIYLDVDTIAVNDITQLFNENLENYILGAVPDWIDTSHWKAELAISNDHIYFNSGVLLINCEKWRKSIQLQDILSISELYPQQTDNDQGILNKYFESNYKLLDKKYNVIFKYNEVVIRHFAGLIKPWQADFSLDWHNRPFKSCNDLYWKYARMTEFYSQMCEIKEKFIASSVLWQRYNKIVNK